MPASPQVPMVFATDEDCFVVGGADFGIIVPTSQAIAEGTDGAFASNARWTLTSATNNFAAQGGASGQILQLLGPTTTYKSPVYMAVDSVTTNSCVLRRPGMAAGIGMPPGPAAGLTGITFKILTLFPQIECAAYDLYDQFGIDENVPWRSPLMVYDPRQFRRLTILRIFYELFQTTNRAPAGDLAAKQKYWSEEFDDVLAMTTIHWGQLGLRQSPTGRFQTRLVR